MSYDDAKKATARANDINNAARRFHTASRRDQEQIMKELKEKTGSAKGAEKAIREAGGGSGALKRFFGR